MKNYLTISLIAVIVFLSGCVPILMYQAGIRKPKEETPESIEAFALKMNQDPGKIFLIKDSASFIDFNDSPVIGKNMFTAIVYNKNGRLLNYKDSASCQWSASNYMSILKPDSVYKVDTSAKADFILNRIMPLDGGHSPVFDTSEYDFVVIITWAKYIAKYNERLYPVLDSVKSNRNAKILTVSLNFDMQRSWNLTDKDKISFKN